MIAEAALYATWTLPAALRSWSPMNDGCDQKKITAMSPNIKVAFVWPFFCCVPPTYAGSLFCMCTIATSLDFILCSSVLFYLTYLFSSSVIKSRSCTRKRNCLYTKLKFQNTLNRNVKQSTRWCLVLIIILSVMYIYIKKINDPITCICVLWSFLRWHKPDCHNILLINSSLMSHVVIIPICQSNSIGQSVRIYDSMTADIWWRSILLWKEERGQSNIYIMNQRFLFEYIPILTVCKKDIHNNSQKAFRWLTTYYSPGIWKKTRTSIRITTMISHTS